MRPGTAIRLVQVVILGLIATATEPRTSAGGGGVPDARLGTPIAPILLLSRADVRDELKLTPEQAAEAEQAISDLYDRARALKGQSGVKADAARREIDRASQAWLAEQLGADQQRRLDQVALQWEGPTALLSRPIVANSLNLTEAQRSALSHAIAARNTRRKDGPPIPEDEAKLAETVRSVLSQAQQEGWNAMIGLPYTFRVVAQQDRSPLRR